MKLLLLLFAGLALCWSDKLDRTYLPPPGSKFSGGSAGDIQTPLEFPKVSPFPGSPGPSGQHSDNEVLTGPANGFESNQQNLQGFGQPRLGQDLQSPFVPSQQVPLNNFQDNLNLPVTTTSSAYNQTTTHSPDFESVTGTLGSFLESQRIRQQFSNVQNVPGQASYPQGNGILNQGSAYDQQSPLNVQSRPNPKNFHVAGQQNYEAPTSQFVNANFLKNERVQNNQVNYSSPTPSSPQYESQNIDQHQKSSNSNIPSGSTTSTPDSQSGFPFQVQPSVFPSLETPQSPALNQYQDSFNNIQPSGIPSFPTTESPITSQFQNIDEINNSLPSAGFQTTQRPIPIKQYQSYGPNTPNQRVFDNNQNRVSSAGSFVPHSTVATSNGPAYPQMGNQKTNVNVGNIGDSQRYNLNNPPSSFDQSFSTPIPTNFVSSAASTSSSENYSPSTPVYSNRQIQAQQSVSVNGPERIQADGDRNAIILNYENVLTPEGFSYSFDTSNGIHADESGTASDGVKATGSYSYTGDDGKVYSVVYTADESGFQPRGDHLPTPPPIPEAILRVIEQANRNKEAGIIPDDGSYKADKYGPKKYQGTMSIVKQYEQHMKGTINKNNLVTPQRGSQVLREEQISTEKDIEVDNNDDEIITEEVESEEGRAIEYKTNISGENDDIVSYTEKPTTGERKSNSNRKQEKPMRKSSKGPSRPKFDTSDKSEDDDETFVTSDRNISRHKSPNGPQRGRQSQNKYQRAGMKNLRRPSSKNSGIKHKVPVSSTNARYEEENRKFNGNPYLPNQLRKNDDKPEINDDDEDSYDYLQSENPSEEDSENSQEISSQINNQNYPDDKRIDSSVSKDVTLKYRPRIEPQKAISNRLYPYQEENDDDDDAIDNVHEYQAENMKPSLMDNDREKNTYKQRKQPSQKKPAYSTRRPFDNNQGQEIGYEYNTPQKTFKQNYPSISIPQSGGAQTLSSPEDQATTNKYDRNTPNNDQRFQKPYGPTSSLQTRHEYQSVTSIPTSTEFPGFESPQNGVYLDNSSGSNNDSLDSIPETKTEPQMTYVTGTTRRPAFRQNLQTTSLAPQYNERFSVNGLNNQLNSQTPTQGQTEGNRFISSTTPLPRRPSTFGAPSTPQRESQYNQDNRNQYSTTARPFTGNNQYYKPGIDSNITRISVLGPKYLPAVTDPSSNDNGFGRPRQQQSTFGRDPSTTYKPNYSIINNTTPGSTPKVRFDGSTTTKYKGGFVEPSQYEQPTNTFTSMLPKGTPRPGYSNDRNIIPSTTKPFTQQGFQQSYQPNAPGVTPSVTLGPTYGSYPINGNASLTTERQYQVFPQQQPTMGPINQEGISQPGPYTPGQRYTSTPGIHINNQPGYQVPAGQGVGPMQGSQTNIGPTRTTGTFQGSNNGAEDFSGPKRPQYFDPETGYHY